jgi:predicted NBD/HSP70 family sugar kinase
MDIYIGLDIGGTKFMVASFDAELNELKRLKYPAPIPFDEGIELLHRSIQEVAGDNRILGIGAAAGGPLNPVTGVISPLHQPEWKDIPLKSIMEERWKCPFNVDVDTNVAAIGEYHLGNYSEKYFLYITLSTGMGGGFLIDGKVYQGKCHPEIAHQSINYRCSHSENIQCKCGVEDCLEAMVSGNGIRRIYGKPAEQLSTEEWDEVAYNIAQGVRNITTILSPEIIVFGGGVSVGGGEVLLKKIESYLQKKLRLVLSPKLILSYHGYDTALIGAAYIAKRD